MLGDLKRYPILKNDPLRAWDAADELLIQEVHSLDPSSKRILVLNDSFGAISCSLKAYSPTVYTDSFLSYKATLLNSNNEIIPLFDLSSLRGSFDLVVMRIPKNLSFLEEILSSLSQLMTTNALLICTAMVKHLPSSAFPMLEKYIGPIRTSLAQKKARLIFSSFEKNPVTNPYPKSIELEGFEKSFFHYSNLFSREKLDVGTRFFLEHVSKGLTGTILDLGCANGIIGIKAKLQNPQSKIIFTDESHMAIQSAKMNYHQFFQDEASFIWSNCFEDGEDKSIDFILCNPPFHAQHVVGDFIAKEMFRHSKRVLKNSGKILVIGNRHLGYQQTLKNYFSVVRLIAENSKFVILEARLK
jgi:23S rRNA (guanine1835-N2)-methyltransferase